MSPLVRLLALLLAVAPAAVLAQAPRRFPIGAVVLARYQGSWVRARIVAEGMADREGSYLVDVNDRSAPIWVRPGEIRPRTLAGVPGTGLGCREGRAVEVWDSGWIPATVLAVGRGDFASFCKVRLGAATTPAARADAAESAESVEWVSTENVRPLGASRAVTTPDRERDGADSASARASGAGAPGEGARDRRRATAPFAVGEHLEGYNEGWWKVTVVEVGTGRAAGYYRVRYDDYPSYRPGWLPAARLRRAGGGVNEEEDQDVPEPIENGALAPRMGRYSCYTYANGGLRAFYAALVLEGDGRYTVPRRGEGRFAYHTSSRALTWRSGPLRDAAWRATFRPDRGGQTHTLVLERDVPRRERVYCLNTSD